MGHSCCACHGEGFISLGPETLKTCEFCLGEGWFELAPAKAQAEIPPIVVAFASNGAQKTEIFRHFWQPQTSASGGSSQR